ncbi:hypothetical protein CCP3SC15_850002 [Gammaproteobacteria bacterium]
MAITTEKGLREAKLPFEDFMDVVDKVEPAETPLYSLCGRESELGNTEFSWTVDSWDTPKGAVGPGDGYAVQAAEIADGTTRKRKMGNVGQAFRRAYGEGWISAQVPKLPGVGKGTLSGTAADTLVNLKRDIDCAFGSFDQQAVQDQGSASGSTMAGLRLLIDASGNAPTGSTYTAASAYMVGRPTDLHFAPTGACVSAASMSASFNLAALKTTLKLLRSATKRNKDYILLCGLDLREAVSGLTDPATSSATGGALAVTTSRSFTQAIADAELGISIDVIRTDWGRLLVVPTDNIGLTTLNSTGGAAGDTARSTRVFTEKPKQGYVLSREKLAKRWGVPFQTEDLSPDGASKSKVLRAYCGLVCYNPTGFGYYLYAA